eukprot:m51a1_g5487 hypothetical protein (265) ;mRNA; r:321443-322458
MDGPRIVLPFRVLYTGSDHRVEIVMARSWRVGSELDTRAVFEASRTMTAHYRQSGEELLCSICGRTVDVKPDQQKDGPLAPDSGDADCLERYFFVIRALCRHIVHCDVVLKATVGQRRLTSTVFSIRATKSRWHDGMRARDRDRREASAASLFHYTRPPWSSSSNPHGRVERVLIVVVRRIQVAVVPCVVQRFLSECQSTIRLRVPAFITAQWQIIPASTLITICAYTSVEGMISGTALFCESLHSKGMVPSFLALSTIATIMT